MAHPDVRVIAAAGVLFGFHMADSHARAHPLAFVIVEGRASVSTGIPYLIEGWMHELFDLQPTEVSAFCLNLMHHQCVSIYLTNTRSVNSTCGHFVSQNS